MHVFAINGTRIKCDWSVVHHLLTSGRMNGAIVLIALAMATFKSTIYGVETSYLGRIVFWQFGVYMTVLYWYLVARIFHAVLYWLKIEIAIFNYLITALATVAAVYSSTTLTDLLLDITLSASDLAWADYFRNLVIAALVEFLIATSIWPNFWSEVAPKDTPDVLQPDDPEKTKVTFKDTVIHLESLLHVRSQEHYLEFVFEQTKLLLRGALKDFVELCDHAHGIQCHRSHWVAKKAVTGRKRHKGSPVLQLSNGTNVPIARGRLADVKAWLMQHRPEI